MPTKSEIESRISRIVQIFKSAIPVISVPFPSVTVSTHRTYRDARALLVAQTGSAAIAAPADDWVAELISGQKGSAILVQKEEVKSLDHLYHVLWSILGRFYLVAAQSGTQSNDEDNAAGSESAKQFWSVFASEAMANRVERYLRREYGNSATKIEWTEAETKRIEEEIKIQLMRAYGQREIEVTELAMLLATVLTDDLLREMISGRHELVTMPGEMQPLLRELVTLLEQQMEKEKYWELDEAALAQISSLLAELNREYQYLIAGELVEDEMAAADIPKGELPDLDEELPEID
jgi:hypothetical protein